MRPKAKSTMTSTDLILLLNGTRVEVWEDKKCCGIFRVCPNSLECFCNSIETWRTCFLFILENTVMKKGKQLINFDYQNVNFLGSCHHYVS